MTTAIAALAASPVLAASETADENAAKASESASMSQDTTGANANADVVSDMQGMQISASDLIGKPVYIRGEDTADAEIGDEASEPADDWERVGEIGDVIISKDGKIDSVTLDAGGFLGINEKHISASMDEMKFVADSSEQSDENDGDSYFVVFTGDKTALEDREELDQTAVREAGSSFFNDDGNEQMASDDVEDAAGEDTANAESTDLSAEQMAENDAAETEQDAEAMAEGETAEAEAADMTDDQMAETDAENAESGETDLTAQQMSDGESATDANQETAQLDSDARGQLTAEELEGVSVYGAEDDRLGEISNLVLTDDGKISEVIVDVGGFLGLGEKPVALPFEDLELRRSDDSMTGGLRATTGYSSEDLEGMDSWEG
ncbi:PRC-barrel domain-containing protein [Roseovarius indicus]|uniref:PRC-barrel domain-containing protein n=1 Tax=Roseovarius indicus TaxID=540747 RepID=UPI0032EBB130